MALTIYQEDNSIQIDDPQAFFDRHERITAGGGVVLDDRNRVLFIFRRGKWDLPKGKAEQGESMETCAIREIKEETGLQELELQRFLLTTYHTYEQDGQPILKDTHWFLFRAPGGQPVQPQTEEDILEIRWVEPDEMDDYTRNTYRLIIEVLKAAGVDDGGKCSKQC